MAKAIYCLKIYMFRNQFEYIIIEKDGLRDICIFIVTIYIEAWFKGPSTAAAPYQDLIFIQKLCNYSLIDINTFQVALCKFRNHFFVTSEAVALIFFNKNISLASERKIIINLNNKIDSDEKIKRINLK